MHLAEPEKIKDIMSNRYQHRQVDGDESEMSSALELAIDQHWYNFFSVKVQAHVLMSIFYYLSTIFLSSSEAQEGVSSCDQWK